MIGILDWKLGNDIEKTLIHPNSFTTENLQSVPFVDWRKQIEKLDATRNTSNK